MLPEQRQYWSSIKELYPEISIPVAVGSPNAGDDIQSLIAARFFKCSNFIERDNKDGYINNRHIVLLCGYYQIPNQFNNGNILFAGTYIYPPIKDKINWTLMRSLSEEQLMPFGARDLSTLQILKDNGIERCVWSGCVSQLIEKEFIPFKKTRKYAINVVNIPNGFEIRSNSFVHLKEYTIDQRLRLAQELLDEYKLADKIITSRLHIYLPLKEMGINIELQLDENVRLQDRFKGFI